MSLEIPKDVNKLIDELTKLQHELYFSVGETVEEVVLLQQVILKLKIRRDEYGQKIKKLHQG